MDISNIMSYYEVLLEKDPAEATIDELLECL